MTKNARNIQERTFQFAVDIVRHCQRLDAKAGVTRRLGRQLLRSGTSIGANVEEAQAAQSSADFVSKCSIALKEARETLYWLRLLDAGDHLANEDGKLLRQEADELSRIIGANHCSHKEIKNENRKSKKCRVSVIVFNF